MSKLLLLKSKYFLHQKKTPHCGIKQRVFLLESFQRTPYK